MLSGIAYLYNDWEFCNHSIVSVNAVNRTLCVVRRSILPADCVPIVRKINPEVDKASVAKPFTFFRSIPSTGVFPVWCYWLWLRRVCPSTSQCFDSAVCVVQRTSRPPSVTLNVGGLEMVVWSYHDIASRHSAPCSASNCRQRVKYM